MQKGFSLIELSIVILVISILIGSSLSIILLNDSHHKTKQTNLKISKIIKYINSFYKINKRLPCPSDNSLNNEDENYALESQDCLNEDSSTMFIGHIPYKSLNISKNFTLDSWDNHFSYAVDTSFSCQTTDCFKNNMGNIVINDGIKNKASAIYIIISHGPNGYGAIKNGKINNPYGTEGNIYEEENSHIYTEANEIFIDKNFSIDDEKEFDDIIYFQTKLNLRQNTYNENCDIAKEILDNNQCNGSIYKNECLRMAKAVTRECL